MPTYEYRCNACGHAFEAFQKMSDDPVETCPECGEDEAERLMSAGAGLVFKGSGFYETDYKQKEEPGGGEAGGDGAGDDGSGADAPRAGGEGAASGAEAGSGASSSADTGGGSEGGA